MHVSVLKWEEKGGKRGGKREEKGVRNRFRNGS
jgi:hypothetical protein